MCLSSRIGGPHDENVLPSDDDIGGISAGGAPFSIDAMRPCGPVPALPVISKRPGSFGSGRVGACVDPRGDVFFTDMHLMNRDGMRAAWSGAMEREVERSLRRGDVHVQAQVRRLWNDVFLPPLRAHGSRHEVGPRL